MVCMTFWYGVADLAAQRADYDIFKGADRVGRIQVSRMFHGERVVYLMGSLSEFTILWKQVVRTSARTEYDGDLIRSCYSSITVNGAVRDSSNMFLGEGREHCYVHPKQLTNCSALGAWSTARMYFEEPVGAASVYVESVLQNCPLAVSGAGTYTLTFPNNTKNHYVYLHGVLQEIQVIRPFFDLFFRKVI